MDVCDININQAQATAFQVTFTKIPNTIYMCQAVNIPSISSQPVSVPTPFIAYPMVGDHLSYDQLNMEFIINADFSNWLELVDWKKRLYFPEDYNQHKSIAESEGGLYGDCVVTLLNSTSNPILRFTYEDCFPISVSGFRLSTVVQDSSEPMVATATFAFSTFTVKSI